MAKSQPAKADTQKQPSHEKLTRLPDGSIDHVECLEDLCSPLAPGVKIHKRPLLHPPIPSPYSSRKSQKVVYLSTKTPFMSAFKRVKRLLKHVENRSLQATLVNSKESRNGIQSSKSQAQKHDEPEEVVIKATGKAIEKALKLALYFENHNDYIVKIRTGTVHAIDDIVQTPIAQKSDLDVAGVYNDTVTADCNIQTAKNGLLSDDDETAAAIQDEELPEARIRRASMIEVAVSLR